MVSEESETKIEIEDLKKERTATKQLADTLSGLESTFKESKAALKSFGEYLGLRDQLNSAVGEESKAKTAEEMARTNYQSIFRSYSLNAAHRLAVNLVDGDDCPVCGSQEHPKKAQATGDDVSEHELESAKTELETRMLKHQELIGNRTQLEEQTNDLGNAHVGQNIETLESAVSKAEEKFLEAKTAKERLDEVSSLLEVGSEFMDSFSALSKNIVELRADLTSKERDLVAAEKLVKQNLNGFASVEDYKESLENHASNLEILINTIAALDTATSDLKKAETKFSKALREQGFVSEQEFTLSVLEGDELEGLKANVSSYNDEGTRIHTLLSQEKFSLLPEKTVPKHEAEAALATATEASTVSLSELAVIKSKLKLIQDCQKRVKGILPTLEKLSANLELHRGLYDALHGLGANTMQMTLETYFAAGELEVILEAANTQLRTMAAGQQFTLVHSDKALKKTGKAGLGIEVIDEHSGGQHNPVTLSGGERFQVSLAIALGLAQVVSERSGSIRIDTLFVDEGFGSLSKGVLETAMNTLDALKQGGRTVGVISHVDKMQESITAKLHVAKIPGGPSFVKAIDV
jgi:exonuclease SbcC